MELNAYVATVETLVPRLRYFGRVNFHVGCRSYASLTLRVRTSTRRCAVNALVCCATYVDSLALILWRNDCLLRNITDSILVCGVIYTQTYPYSPHCQISECSWCPEAIWLISSQLSQSSLSQRSSNIPPQTKLMYSTWRRLCLVASSLCLKYCRLRMDCWDSNPNYSEGHFPQVFIHASSLALLLAL